MITAALIEGENSTIVEVVKTDADNYNFIHRDDLGITGFCLNKKQATELHNYLKITLEQKENW